MNTMNIRNIDECQTTTDEDDDNILKTQLNKLQSEYQTRLEEIKIIKEEKLIIMNEERSSKLHGFPSKRDLDNKKIRVFYTGIPSYKVLIATLAMLLKLFDLFMILVNLIIFSVTP